MKYYCEVLNNLIINKGTFDGELQIVPNEEKYVITKEQYNNIEVGETLYTEI
jgi:hypothetical protein